MFFQSETRRLKSAIAAHDAGLGQSLSELARALNLGPATTMAGQVGTKALGIARAHPVPVAIAGAGLAWLILRPRAAAQPGVETLSRWEDEGGQVLDPAAVVDTLDANNREWLAAARAARDAARDRLLDLYERGMATAEARASVTAEQAEGLAKAFRQNLAHLGAEAAERTADTRRRAWEALEQGGKLAERSFDQGRQLAKDHPVAASVTGLAVGAGLIALALRGRGVFKLFAPLAMSAALTEAALRLTRRTPAEKVADAVEDAGDAVKKTARRTTRAAKATAGDVSEAVSGTARAAKAKAKPVVKAAARSAEKTTRAARGTVKSAAADARKAAATVGADVAELAPNGAAKH
jgi:hypothetical protein